MPGGAVCVGPAPRGLALEITAYAHPDGSIQEECFDKRVQQRTKALFVFIRLVPDWERRRSLAEGVYKLFEHVLIRYSIGADLQSELICPHGVHRSVERDRS